MIDQSVVGNMYVCVCWYRVVIWSNVVRGVCKYEQLETGVRVTGHRWKLVLGRLAKMFIEE